MLLPLVNNYLFSAVVADGAVRLNAVVSPGPADTLRIAPLTHELCATVHLNAILLASDGRPLPPLPPEASLASLGSLARLLAPFSAPPSRHNLLIITLHPFTTRPFTL